MGLSLENSSSTPASTRLLSVVFLAAGLLCASAPAAWAGKAAAAKPRRAAAKPAARPAAQEPQRIPRRAPESTVAVQGIVRNDSGHGVPEVEVTLRGGPARSRQTSTNAEGIFRFMEVQPGTYAIQALKPGHETLERKDLVVKAGEFPVWEFTIKSMTPVQSSTACGPSVGLPKCPESGPLTEPALQQSSYRELRRRTAEEATAGDGQPSLPEESDVFISLPDRWDAPNPEYRRYPGKKGDVLYVKPHWYDPFNVNRFKGDKPILGNKLFFAFTGLAETTMNGVRVPLPSNVAAARPGSTEFFGRGELFFLSETFRLSFELFHGTTQAFRPVDWRIKVTPAFNVTYLNTQERGIVNIDPRRGTNRFDSKSASVQEAFFEVRLKDLSPNFDVLFLRTGIQQFTSDFRGFIYVEEQPGVRIFGNLHSNKWEYNLAYFYHLRKDANSGLNEFNKRRQQVFIANIYFQDFLGALGYTSQFSFHYNKEEGDFVFDKNGFLVRPSPIGAVHSSGQLQPHKIRALYLGWAGQGHFGRLNVSHAFYQVAGEDTRNELAARKQTINGQMAAAELSYDKDWIRLRSSFFFASGDSKPRDNRARGFDSIVDNPVFIGGPFSFWNREGIRLLGSGVALTSGNSLLPALRASNVKELSHSSFVNPGIFIYNAGMDIELTPKLRSIINVNYLRFHRTEPLEVLLFQAPIRHSIGVDYSFGFQYRPPLTDNIVILLGVSSLQPGQGFIDIYTNKTLWSVFTNVKFLF